MTKLKSPVILDNYEKLECVGSGSFCQVYKVREKETGKIYSLKIFMKKLIENTKELKSRFLSEVNIISQINHPSIIKFIGYSPVDFEKKSKPVIITEYAANNSLQHLFDLERIGISFPFWNDTMKLICIYGIASGVSYLHSRNVNHRDLKPGNILLDEYLFPKISDFGLASIIHENNENKDLLPTRGTPMYIAPEIWKKSQYTKQGDVYSFSILMYQIYVKEEPFKDYSSFDLFEKVVSHDYRPEIPKTLPKAYKEMIEKCWSKDPNDRPSFKDIVEQLRSNEEFITETVDKEYFLKYIEYIDQCKDKSKNESELEDFIQQKKSETFKVVSVQAEVDKFNEAKRAAEELIANTINCPGFKELPEESQEILNNSLIKSTYKIKKIYIHSNDMNKLCEKGTLSSPVFVDALKQYEENFIDVDYPSTNFKQIMEVLSNIKQNEIPHLNIKVIVSSDVTNVDNSAFEGLSSITHVFIPSSITSIGSQAFKGCEAINKVSLENPSSLSSIESSLFYGCTSLADFTIPYSSKAVKEYAFYDCKSLTRFVIPSSVKTIDKYAFCGCTSLTIININSQIPEISDSSFQGCTSLKLISIPRSVQKIGSNSFEGCTSLEKIIIPASVTSIGKGAFKNCISLNEAEILSTSIESFENEIFSGCSSLSQIKVPSFIVSIGESSFSDCTSLTEISLPSSIASVADKVFSNCTSLSLVSFPCSIQSINKSAFEGCSILEESTTDSTVNVKGEQAFCKCTSLKRICIDPIGTNQIFENKLFDSVQFTNVIKLFDNTIVTIQYPSDGFKSMFNSVAKLRQNESLHIKLRVLCSGTKKISNFYEMNDDIDELKIGSSVESIDKEAFKDFLSLTEIIIPPSVTSIGENAFKNCSSLTHVEIPPSVSNLGWGAFIECKSLTDISIPSSIKLIPEYSFYKCENLANVSIPSSVIEIGSFAFLGCTKLLSIYIPPSVKIIGDSAFEKTIKLRQKPSNSSPKKKKVKKSSEKKTSPSSRH